MTGRPVVHVVDDLRVGGAQRLLLTFAREAGRRKLAVTVVSLSPPKHGAIEHELRELGAEVVFLPPPRGGPAGRLPQVVALARLLRSRRPIAVQTHLTYANVLGTLAGRLARVPVLATLHNGRPGADGNHRRMVRIETLCLRYASRAVVAVGAVVESGQRHRLGSGRAVVVPNAVDASRPPEPDAVQRRRRELVDDDGPIVLAVGRLVPAKGYTDLLDAFARVREAVPSARLAIVGTGPLEASLEQLCRAAEPVGSVRLLGERDDVPQLLAAADVFVSASHWEGLPVALLEAMSAGVPVVATAVGDIPSVVDESTGLLVPPQSPDALAAAVVALLQDRVTAGALAASARQRVLDAHGPPAWLDRLLGLYDAVGGHPGRDGYRGRP